MERSRATWTDERLDDLARRVDDGFKRNDEDMRQLGARIDSLEVRIDGRFNTLEARLDSRFESLETRIDSLQRTMIQFGGSLTAAILATLAAVIVTHA